MVERLVSAYGPYFGRFRAFLLDQVRLDRDEALRLTERLIVSYRRQLAGYAYAVATGRDRGEVAADLGVGHLSRPDSDDGGYWTAAGRLA
jgi:hypothetical protein